MLVIPIRVTNLPVRYLQRTDVGDQVASEREKAGIQRLMVVVREEEIVGQTEKAHVLLR